MSEAILVRFSRKPCSLDQVRADCRDPENFAHNVQVTETKELSTTDYDEFTQTFLANREWLSGKGGVRNGKWNVIEVIAQERTTLYVNPEGYAYARYVGLREAPIQATDGPKYSHVRVQLVGMDGNAHFILGRCQHAAKIGGVPAEKITAFINEAQSGDYNHLLATCMRWFDCY
jgi:hypothetical protein